MAASLSFRSARYSAVKIEQLGSGQYDYLGLFGALGHLNAVPIGDYNDTSIVVDSNGNPIDETFGGSGYLTNNKLVDTNTTRISGLPLGPYDSAIDQVNVFDPANLATEPDFLNRPSGTLLVIFQASGTEQVHLFNSQLYAYQAGGPVSNGPLSVDVFAYEINASGQTFSAAYSGVWTPLQGSNGALFFANHSSINGWQAANIHWLIAGITASPRTVGLLNDFRYAFSTSFA